jgi:pimeloyl-ACP methyl ester carboxylesterase
LPYIDANGLRFHTQVLNGDQSGGTSARPKVVMIHGLIVVNLASYYYTIAPPVSRLADTYLYDLRGNGRSETPKHGYGVAHHVADLRSLLRAWDIDREPVHLVANSFGGTVALAFARQFPELVASLVMIDAMLDVRIDPSTLPPADGPDGADWVREHRLALAALFRLDEKTVEYWTSVHGTRKQDRVAQVTRKLVRETSLVDDLGKERPCPTEALRSLGCPMLAIYGENSDLLDQAHVLESNVPRCELHVLPNCGHMVLSEGAPFVVERVTEWLTRFGAGRSDQPTGREQ